MLSRSSSVISNDVSVSIVIVLINNRRLTLVVLSLSPSVSEASEEGDGEIMVTFLGGRDLCLPSVGLYSP